MVTSVDPPAKNTPLFGGKPRLLPPPPLHLQKDGEHEVP
jgi:hypothetical protein